MPSAYCKSVQDYVTILIECFLVCAPTQVAVLDAVKFLRERFLFSGVRVLYASTVSFS